MTETNPTESEIAAMTKGDKLVAVKRLRERLHLGFLEAKTMIEQWMTKRPWEHR